MMKIEEAHDELYKAAQAIEADLSGNADNRIHQTGSFIMIEEARVRWLLRAVKKLRSAKGVTHAGEA